MCQLSPILLISSQEELNPQLFQHPLWWKGPKWLIQEPSSWPTTEDNTPTEHLEMRNVHVALRQHPEDFTQSSRLCKLIRIVAYCRRFINSCRYSKAKQTTTLSTQDLDQALTCCVKMVQQISYTQEMKDLMEQQEVASTSSLKTLHPFIDQEGLLRVGRLQQSTLPYQAMHQMILPPNHQFTKWLSQQNTYDFIMLGHNF